MFICKSCFDRRMEDAGIPANCAFFLPVSRGKCEDCKDVNPCADIPSASLPVPSRAFANTKALVGKAREMRTKTSEKETAYPRTEKQYPEHEKLARIQEQSQWLGEFLDWLQNSQNCCIAYYHREELARHPNSIQQWLAAYFDIDLCKIEDEKQAMLEELRKAK